MDGGTTVTMYSTSRQQDSFERNLGLLNRTYRFPPPPTLYKKLSVSSLRRLVGANYCWIAVTAVGNVKREMLKQADGTVSMR